MRSGLGSWGKPYVTHSVFKCAQGAAVHVRAVLTMQVRHVQAQLSREIIREPMKLKARMAGRFNAWLRRQGWPRWVLQLVALNAERPGV